MYVGLFYKSLLTRLHVYGSLLTHLLARNNFFFPIRCVTWLLSTFEIWVPFMWHDSGQLRMRRRRAHEWHDSFLCVTWLILMWNMTRFMCGVTSSNIWHDMTQVNFGLDGGEHVCDMTHSYVWQDSWHDAFLCVTRLMTWRIPMCDMTHDMTHSYVWHDWRHDSFLCVTRLMTWRIPMCDMTDGMTRFYVWHDSGYLRTKRGWAQVWHDSFLCVTWLMTWLLLMCDTTQVNYGLDGGEHTTVRHEVAQMFPTKKRKSSRSLSSGKHMNIYTHSPTHTRMCVCSCACVRCYIQKKRKSSGGLSSGKHTHTHTYIHIHIYSLSRTHTRACVYLLYSRQKAQVVPRFVFRYTHTRSKKREKEREIKRDMYIYTHFPTHTRMCVCSCACVWCYHQKKAQAVAGSVFR